MSRINILIPVSTQRPHSPENYNTAFPPAEKNGRNVIDFGNTPRFSRTFIKLMRNTIPHPHPIIIPS